MTITSTPNSLILQAATQKGTSQNSPGNDTPFANLINDIGVIDPSTPIANQLDIKTAFSDLLSQQMQSQISPQNAVPETHSLSDNAIPDIAAITSDSHLDTFRDPNVVNFALQQIATQLNPAPPSVTVHNDVPQVIASLPKTTHLQKISDPVNNVAADTGAAEDHHEPLIIAPLTTPGVKTTTPLAPDFSSQDTSINDFSTQLSTFQKTTVTSVIESKLTSETKLKMEQNTSILSATATSTLPQVALHTNNLPQVTQLEPIAAPLPSAHFAEEAADRVKFVINNNIQSAQININPAELGPIRIHLHLNSQNDIAQISFSAALPETRQALENALPRLRELLADSGIQLAGQQMQHQTAQQSFQQTQQQAFQNSPTLASNTNAIDQMQTITLPLKKIDTGNGLLDLYA